MPSTTPIARRGTSKAAEARKSKATSKTQAAAVRKSAPRSGAGDISNYPSALRWLYAHTDYEKLRIVSYNKNTFSLDRMRKLLELLGDPQGEIRAVQVAGTKGKGST